MSEEMCTVCYKEPSVFTTNLRNLPDIGRMLPDLSMHWCGRCLLEQHETFDTWLVRK